MKYVSRFYGVTTMPERETVLIIFEHVFDLYRDLTLDDIKLAVRLNSGGLCGKPVRTYDVFSAATIDDVLRPYIDYRREVLSRVRRNHTALPEPADRSTDEEYYTTLVRMYRNNGKLPPFYAYREVFRFLVDSGRVVINDVEQAMVTEQAEAESKQTARGGLLRSVEPDRVESIFQKIIVRNYFRSEFG